MTSLRVSNVRWCGVEIPCGPAMNVLFPRRALLPSVITCLHFFKQTRTLNDLQAPIRNRLLCFQMFLCKSAEVFNRDPQFPHGVKSRHSHRDHLFNTGSAVIQGLTRCPIVRRFRNYCYNGHRFIVKVRINNSDAFKLMRSYTGWRAKYDADRTDPFIRG